MAVEALEIEITSKAQSAVNSIDQLASALTRLRRRIMDVTSYKGSNTLHEAVAELNSALERINVERLSQVADSMKKIGDAASSARRAVRALSRETESVSQPRAYTGIGGRLGALQERYGRAEDSAREMVPSAFRGEEYARVIGEDISRFASGVKGALPHMVAFGKTIASMGFQLASRGLRAMANGFKSFGAALVSPIKKVQKFFSMVGRMALYRAIRGAIRLISQGVKEGTENFAKWDYATGQLSGANAVKTLNEYGNAFAYLKNSVGAAAMPILQILLPAIQSIINYAVQAANAISALVSAIMGLTNFFGASASTGYDLADSFKAAGGGASKLKNTILGFDELNVMNDQNSGGGGGGGGTMSGITENLFEKLDIPEWATYLAGKLKEAWANADFTDIGTLVGDKVTVAIKNINWTSVKNKLANTTKSIATLLNGLVRSVPWGDFGAAVSDGIVWALNNLANFIGEVRWDEIGRSISDFLNNISVGDIIDAIFNVIKSAMQGGIDLLIAAEWDGELGRLANEMWDALCRGFGDADFWELHNVLMYLIDKAVFGSDYANWYWSKGEYAGKEIIMGWISGVESMEGAMTGAMESAGQSAGEALSDGVQSGWSGVNGNAGPHGHTKNELWLDVKLNLPKDQTIQFNSDMVQLDLSGLKKQVQTALTGIQAMLGFKPYLVNKDLFVKINSGFNSQEQKLSFRDITGYAEGGFPSAGLFLAGESGPEMVGTIGGRTAVANSDQIVAAIASGVASVMAGSNSILREQNDILRGIAEKDGTVVVSTSDIAAGMSRMNRRAGATVMPVGA